MKVLVKVKETTEFIRLNVKQITPCMTKMYLYLYDGTELEVEPVNVYDISDDEDIKT